MQGTSDRGEPAGEGDELIGTLVADRYRIVRKLGQGGMGTVYLAVHEKLRKDVALKLLDVRAGSDKEAVARFEREAIASANLRHPNIAQASDFGRLPDGSLYLVMEYIDGKTAQALLDASPGGLPPGRVLRILRQVADALALAHAQHVVHRDLKPANLIVFDRGDERDVVKVIDFGIARIRSAVLGEGARSITVAGAVFGTPEYMAPEQVMGQTADARADQYAFGVTAFELLTGRVPYTETDVQRLLMKHISAPIPSARESAPHLPPTTNDVFAKLLAKRPDDRYPTIVEAFTALEAALGGAGVSPASTGGSGTVRMDQRASAPSATPVVAQASAPMTAADMELARWAPATTVGPLPHRLAMTRPLRRARSPAGEAARKAAAQVVETGSLLADKLVRAAKKRPAIVGGAALAGVLLIVAIVLVARAVSSPFPAGTRDALGDWEHGAYAQAAPKLRAELGRDASLAEDPELVRVIAGAVQQPEGRDALQDLLDDTSLGRSRVMAAALADVAVGDPSAARNGALRLLRGRGELLSAEPRARVAYRDASDCLALVQALNDLAQAGTAQAKADLEGHRGGRCAQMVRRDEICGCSLSPPAGRGKRRSSPR
jgi:serine/threonine-protein kinase